METTQFHIAQVGLFSGQYFLSIEGDPTKQFDPHEKSSWWLNTGHIDIGIIRNLNAFTFDI